MKLFLKALIFLIFIISSTSFADSVPAVDGGFMLPSVTIGMSQAGTPQETASVVRILILLTILSLAPAILMTMTSFTRIVVVLSFLRQALGVQSMPPNQVIISLALFLSFFIMAPTLSVINQEAIGPYMSGSMPQDKALEKIELKMREFMFSQTREKDLGLLLKVSKYRKPNTKEEVPTHVLIPAFMISELKTAFQIGFMVYLPFLIIDMVVASILMSMGMMMLPPAMISMPFKLLLFVLVDGWALVVSSLVKSFG